MIDQINISVKELNNLHSKGKQVDPKILNLGNISNSGMHVGEISDQSAGPNYDLGKLSHSGRHIFDVTEEI